MMRGHRILISLMAIALATHASAKSIVLRSGDVVSGEIVRTDAHSITIRTSSGISNYRLNELDPDWATNYSAQRETNAAFASPSVPKSQGRQANRSNPDSTDSNWFPDFYEHVLSKENLVTGLSALFLSIGLFLCFFGWRMFRFFTVLGGTISGLIMGLLLAGLILSMASKVMPDSVPGMVGLVLFVIIAAPLALFGARYGRRFAMFNARSRRLQGMGKGMANSIFALSRYAFFDFSIVWGHAFIGAFFICLSCFGFLMKSFAIPEQHQKALWIGCGVIALCVCIFGSISQIHGLRSDKCTENQGEYLI